MEFQFQFDWQAAINSIPYLAKGIPYTLMISFGGLAIGFVLGIVFGLLSINKNWFLRWPATAYIEIFRGTPILVLPPDAQRNAPGTVLGAARDPP